MIITKLSYQSHNADRVNVFVDGKYSFSLGVVQLPELKVRVGKEVNDDQLAEMKAAGELSKLYGRALEYVLTRPRSVGEMRLYLKRKTPAGDQIDNIISRLINRKYLDDKAFASYWVSQRNLTKGISARVLRNELMAKGVARDVIDQVMDQSDRTDAHEIKKVISRVSRRYDTPEALMRYLASIGYRYDDIKTAVDDSWRRQD